MREWLKELRLKKGMTQAEVAELAGISQQQYNYIEKGVRCKADKNETEKRIAEVLGFDWTKFFEI